MEHAIATTISMTMSVGIIAWYSHGSIRSMQPCDATKRRRRRTYGGGDTKDLAQILVPWREMMVEHYSFPGATGADIGCGRLQHRDAFERFSCVFCLDRAQVVHDLAKSNLPKQLVPIALTPAGGWDITKKVDVMYLFDTLKFFWTDSRDVVRKMAHHVVSGGCVVMCIKNPDIKPPYKAVRNGDTVIDIQSAGPNEVNVTRYVDNKKVSTKEPAIAHDELIERMARGNFSFAHSRRVELQDSAVARAFRTYVFLKKTHGVEVVANAYKAARVRDILFPGGISFNQMVLRKNIVCPLWLLRIADVDTNCICRNHAERDALLGELKKVGITFGPPRKVGKFYLYANEEWDIDLGIAFERDTARDLWDANNNGIMSDRGIVTETSMFLFLSYCALIQNARPSHTRAFKIDKLSARMIATANGYVKHEAALNRLRKDFQEHMGKTTDHYDLQWARRFYTNNSHSVDQIVRDALRETDLRMLESILRKYMAHTLNGVDFDKMRKPLTHGGAVDTLDAYPQIRNKTRSAGQLADDDTDPDFDVDDYDRDHGVDADTDTDEKIGTYYNDDRDDDGGSGDEIDAVWYHDEGDLAAGVGADPEDELTTMVDDDDATVPWSHDFDCELAFDGCDSPLEAFLGIVMGGQLTRALPMQIDGPIELVAHSF